MFFVFRFSYFLLSFTVLMSVYADMNVLISSLKNKEEKAYTYLYDNYSAALYGIILKVVDNTEDAADVLQESFLNIWKNIESYDPAKGGSLFTWMLNISRNKAIDRFRQKNRVTQNQNGYKFVHIQNKHINPNVIKTDTIGLQKVVQQIKPELVELIDLHYFKGYTHQEITDLTRVPLGTVKTRIRSAMTELKKAVGIK